MTNLRASNGASTQQDILIPDTVTELSENEIMMVSGAGFWYQVGKFLAGQSNASDAIYAQYGFTNQNHW